ncbi:MAG TPA: hypothetical protein VIF02_00365 [Methylocella sp.]|jgi:hypothetical protein
MEFILLCWRRAALELSAERYLLDPATSTVAAWPAAHYGPAAAGGSLG